MIFDENKVYLTGDPDLHDNIAKESTMAKWRMAGTGPAYIRLGPRRVGYHGKDLNDWLRSRRTSTDQQ